MASSADTVCYKILLVGDPGVGKTALLRRLTGKTFPEQYSPSASFERQTVRVDRIKITIDLWVAGSGPTAGTELIEDPQGVLVMYDCSRRKTFDSVKKWLDLAQSYGDVPVYLCGSKCELGGFRPSVKELKALNLWDTQARCISAKAGISYDLPLLDLADCLARGSWSRPKGTEVQERESAASQGGVPALWVAVTQLRAQLAELQASVDAQRKHSAELQQENEKLTARLRGIALRALADPPPDNPPGVSC